MAYSRTEYSRKETDDHRDNENSGWRSWFGLGSNKDRDDNDRGYSYQRTTTYRDEHPTQYQSSTYDRPSNTRYTSNYDRDQSSYNTVGGYAGARGGYGYTTTGDMSTRPYGQSYGYDRENNRDGGYYRAETRTYGGDRDNTYSSSSYPRYGADNNTSYKRETTTYAGDRSPSRGYGFSGDNNYSTSYNTSRGYDRDAMRGGGDNNYSYRQSTTYGGDRDRHPASYGFSGDYSRPTGGYSTSYRY